MEVLRRFLAFPSGSALVRAGARGVLTGVLLLVVSLSLCGCRGDQARPGGQQNPDVVVAELVRRLRRLHGTEETGAAVVELLWEPARKNLQQRATRATAVSSRELTVGEMIAPSWLALHLEVEHFEWRRQGEWAEVRGIAADGRSVTTRCVLEEGKWRVVLELPPVPPIRLRADELEDRRGVEPGPQGLIYP